MKAKKCKVCKNEFTPIYTTAQSTCSLNCAIEQAAQKKSQAWKERKKVLKDELTTVQDLMKVAQQVFNKYIRLRDEGNLCVSCGKTINGVRHASHYLSAGGHSAVRFNPDNVWVSCFKCNVMLSGNGIEYRMRLINKIGVERVEWLENNGSIAKKWTREELQEIIKEYKLKYKELESK